MKSFVVIVLLFVEVIAYGQTVTLLDSVDRPHGSSGSIKYSSCWGWVAPDGHEYAILGCYGGTSFFDLQGDSLYEVGFIANNSSQWREIKTYKHYAYIVTEAGNGVQIIDLSGLPDTVILVKNFIYSGLGGSTTRNHSITIADGYLYLNGSATWAPSGTLIFSLKEDPTTPTFVGQFQPKYIHDVYVRNDTLFGAAIYSGGGMYIVDVSDKSNPVQLGYVTYAGSGTHNTWCAINGKYAYTTDEIGSSGYSLKVWNISSLPSFTQMPTTYEASPTEIIHNVHGRGNYLYIAHYTAGMRVVSVRDPAVPVEVGYFDTYPGASQTYNGCWGVYPYFPSGRWIGSDRQTGLSLCRFDSLAPRIRPSLIEPANGGEVYGSWTYRWTSAANQAEDPHHYEIEVNGPGVHSNLTTTDTAYTFAGDINYQWGEMYTWKVWTKDEYTEVVSVDSFQFRYYPETPSMHTYSVTDRWNLVSLQLHPFTFEKDSVFPSAVTSAFVYSAGKYTARNTLVPGEGYWVKFDSAETFSLLGTSVHRDSIDIIEGWNLIGVISDSVDVGNVETIPPNILISDFLGYENGYMAELTSLVPGKAYWVHASANGTIILHANGFVAQRKKTARTPLSEIVSSIRIADARGNAQKLYFGRTPSGEFSLKRYEMPPLPPSGVFDVRYASQRMLETYSSGTGSFPLQLTSVDYPLIITTNSTDGQKTFLVVDGQRLMFDARNTIYLEHSVSRVELVVEDAATLPKDFSLEQNYPNPFNPSTMIRFSIPVSGNSNARSVQVVLSVFDIFGREVVTLVNEQKEPGIYEAQWNSTGMASGMYFYRLKAGGFSDTKKMLLLR